MTGLESIIRKKLAQKPMLLMTHMVLGYPSFDDNWRMLETMKECGADLVELQFPFSEPVADGPVFVRANQKSLDQGTRVEQCFAFMKKASAAFDLPFLMMGYYNTVYAMGEDVFIQRLKSNGGCGYIVPDLPIAVGSDFFARSQKADLAPVMILTPNSSAERLKKVASHSGGFVYCVARKGVTGKKTQLDNSLDAYLGMVRQSTRLPIALGFGLKSRADANALRGKADIAIIGTASLEAWERGGVAALKACLS